MHSPDTRPSLILRLKDLHDVQAWNDFAEIYEPLVYRLARKLGMQHADALEAKQEVMLHLVHVVENWQQRPGGSFRGWLYRVARNVMLRHLEQRRRDPKGTGDTQQHVLLAEIEAPELTAEFDVEFKRQVFAWTSRRVRAEVEPTTWQAFWRTYVDGVPVSEVAAQLGISKGNVYVARSRVMKRLRERVQKSLDQSGADPITEASHAEVSP